MPQRTSLKRTFLTAALASMTCLPSVASAAEKPTARLALGSTIRPIQKGVEFDTPAENEIDRCTVELIEEGKIGGWVVYGPEGQTLRKFLDTNNDKNTDLWCYFKDGVEVYRDIDSDFDNRADQYRWLGTAGTRWALDRNEDGKIDLWKSISAEELAAELVLAIANTDEKRFERLLITPQEIDSIGMGDEFGKQIKTKSEQAASQFLQYAKNHADLKSDAKWLHFAAAQPGTIPAGTRGTEKDLTVYENAVTMFESSGETGQLMIGTIVRVGDTWKLIDLPADASSEDLAGNGFFFSGPAIAGMDPAAAGAPSEDMQTFFAKLETIDKQLETASGRSAAQLHDRRADCLEDIIAAHPRDQRESWIRQLVDTVAAAIQTDSYPGGINRLEKLSKSLAGQPDLQAYVEYQLIAADYASRLSKVKDQKEFPKVAEWWFNSLETFANEHANTPEAAQAMLQLGLSKEFEDDEKAAIGWYARVAKKFPNTDAGKKAAGAVLRLESVGRKISLKGTTLDNKSFDLSRLQGKPVVIHYWATWCEPCKQDMKVLTRLQSRYARAGLTIVGINVDGVRDDAVRYANANRIPWINLHADGGLDGSPLANALGVQTLPTMLLIDKAGKVVRHNITIGQLDTEIDAIVR